MTRYPDWQLRWEAYVRERQTTPFAWGSNDCCMFAADAVEALTGERLLVKYRRYKTEEGAARMMARLGGLRNIATTALGRPEVSPKLATVGDVVLVPMNGAEALGVCNGGVAFGPSITGGVAVVSMRDALTAWRVG